ncbi:unnamed protein product [Rotaria sp. Silwood2]|nr:unnamed protein product [Rotaria sp. Silwood2]CAF2524600.1 unnamed protein product [Rotaria sp. Silwood2]CAF2771833.1 unnamed protein product [Rotaria sp. Silwood2]CAF2947245.1 unnamed protein product [Rotaria sp. Silwood2]CAF4125144.1 unnamed protein product [Rotaria sp. Silwood2]
MSKYKSISSSIKTHQSTASLPKEEVNVVLLGKQSVGKSALVVKYLTKRFICEYDPFLEDTYWKPDVVDQQEVLVKVMDTYGKDNKRLPYYLKWADAVLITYSITQQDSFDMALAYLDAITSYSKSLTVSTNELVLMLLGNKLDLERLRVIPKCEGEAVAAKYSCAFCETTAADDYEYVQQLFHRTVREVRKERERVVASNSIDEEPSTIPMHSIIHFPSPSSSSSSNSSIHFTISNETEKLSNIPVPPPIPVNLIQKPTKLIKPDSQISMNSSSTANLLFSSPMKVGSPTTTATTNNIPAATTPNTKRSSSKPSLISKIFR